jgi:outer membrane receptor protein involved in Fe transport
LRLRFSDFDFLVTDAFELTYRRWNNGMSCGSGACPDDVTDLLTIETWYNQTRFKGNAQGSGKRAFMPRLTTVIGLTTGLTEGYNQSMGVSIDKTWFQDAGGTVSLGVDTRYLKQGLNEFDAATTFVPTTLNNFPIPDAFQVNPGLYIESSKPIGDLTIRSGGRVDIVDSDAETDAVLVDGNQFLPDRLGGGRFNRTDFLFSGFITAEYQVNDCVTMTGGVGNSMRTPTMTELYARSPSVSIMPQFAGTILLGNPSMDREKRYQIDLGMHVDQGSFRAGATAFHAWVHDYITLDNVANIRDPAAGFEILLPSYQFTNTDLATISGFELYLEHDANDWITTFANMNYSEGRDHSRFETQSPIALNSFGQGFRSGSSAQEEPLFGIAPLETRLGVRLNDPNERFGIEFAARIIDNQDRIALSLAEQKTPGYTTFDLRVFMRPSDNVLLILGVENFTDKQYQNHFDPRHLAQVFQPGISFFFGSEVTY